MGKKRKKKIPERKCVGCGDTKPKKELIRIVRTPEGEIEVDTTGKKNGRGAYICPEEECLKEAFKKKRLEGSLKKQIPESKKEELLANWNESIS